MGGVVFLIVSISFDLNLLLCGVLQQALEAQAMGELQAMSFQSDCCVSIGATPTVSRPAEGCAVFDCLSLFICVCACCSSSQTDTSRAQLMRMRA